MIFSCCMCGEAFERKRKRIYKFCSRRCANRANQSKTVESSKKSVERICRFCNGKFTGRTNKLFCSDECFHESGFLKGRGFSSQIKYRYGITLQDYTDLLAKQEGKCVICQTEKAGRKNSRRLCVDHDHATGRVRGLLCYSCNTLLGHAKDDVEILAKAILYLRGDEKIARYDYRCPKCKRVQELHHSMMENPIILCCEQECGGIPMERQISLSSFSFKGTGWSQDGYGTSKK